MDRTIGELARSSSHKTVATWAADCAERVLHYFKEEYPEDSRPGDAIGALRTWVLTGVFRMAEVRSASLAAHAAARAAGEHSPARSAARAAGQALAAAHHPGHAVAAAIYAATAVRDAASPLNVVSATLREREWQYGHLLWLMQSTTP